MSKLGTRREAPPTAENSHEELLKRIASSSGFRRSVRLRGFLTYVCERAAAGRLDEINEQYIGHRVFGRDKEYDPSSDNIVRVQARELRKRLDAYFATEGSDEPVILSIPKGGYVPVFEPRPAEVSEPEGGPEAGGAHSKPHRTLLFALAALSAVLFGISAWLFTEVRTLKSNTGAVDRSGLVAQFWGGLFSGDQPTLIALADSNFSLLQDLRREEVPFQEYVTGRYFSSLVEGASEAGEAARIYGVIASRHYTSLADVNMVHRLMSMNSGGAPVSIHFARGLEIRDLKSHNSIILGSVRSNPLAAVFEEYRRFRIEYDLESGRPLVRDTRPEEGRPSVYLSGLGGEDPYNAYGVVACLPNLDKTGHVLLIAGTNMQATEAAGEFVSNFEDFEQWLERIGWAGGDELPGFEVLLRLTTVGNSSYSSEIIASELAAREDS